MMFHLFVPNVLTKSLSLFAYISFTVEISFNIHSIEFEDENTRNYSIHTRDRVYLTTIFMFNAFRCIRTMMIMRWCNVQTGENKLQANMYQIVCTQHRLHCGVKTQLSQDLYEITAGYDGATISDTQPRKHTTKQERLILPIWWW